MATIATHVGHALSQEHNIRDEKRTSKDGHIDKSKSHLNEVIKHEDIKDAYHRIFDVALEAYNARQKRADRKIEDYYKAVCENKQKHPAYEMIIGVYPEAGEKIDDKTGKEIMCRFVNSWQERNKNLELIGAYYHADEDGKPHIHIDFIPVGKGLSRGMSFQNAFDKALRQQGFEKKEAERDDNGKLTQAWETPQIAWERRENKALEKLCNEYGIKVSHPERGKKTKHLHTEEYKELEQVRKDLTAEKKTLADFRERNNLNATEFQEYFENIRQLKDETQEGGLLNRGKAIVPANLLKSFVKAYENMWERVNELVEKCQSMTEKVRRFDLLEEQAKNYNVVIERLTGERDKALKRAEEIGAEKDREYAVKINALNKTITANEEAHRTQLGLVEANNLTWRQKIERALGRYFDCSTVGLIQQLDIDDRLDLRERYVLPPDKTLENVRKVEFCKDKLVGDMYAKINLYGEDNKFYLLTDENYKTLASAFEPETIKPGCSFELGVIKTDSNGRAEFVFTSREQLDCSGGGGLTMCREVRKELERELQMQR